MNLPYDTVLKDFQFYIQEKVLLETHYDKKNVYLSNVAYQRRSTTDLPFYLSFSYGVAKYDGQELRDFLAEMDEKMYNEKKVNLGLK